MERRRLKKEKLGLSDIVEDSERGSSSYIFDQQMEKNGEFIELEQTERYLDERRHLPTAEISTALKVLNSFEV